MLSYVPQAERVLANLGRRLSPDGALYLGVNGSVHHSVRWRAALVAMGLNPRQWRDDRATRDVLRLFDAMAERTPTMHLARRPAAYSRERCVRAAVSQSAPGVVGRNGDTREAAFSRQPSLWRFPEWHVRAQARHMLLRPRSRAEHHLIEELLMPAGFHRLLFTAQPAPVPPWMEPESLLDVAAGSVAAVYDAGRARGADPRECGA